MKHWWQSSEEDAGGGWIRAEMKHAFEGASILVVEDDPDIRDLLVTLLQMAGYTATAWATAEQGLNALREETFEFVLTDYALPNRNGGWLLQQAQQEGLLDATPALVVTAHPNPPDVHGFDVFPKPFELDDLVNYVRQRLDDGGSRRPREAGTIRPAGSHSRGNNNHHDGCPEPIELILYVGADSPRSGTAIDNIKRALSRYRADKVTLTICDLAKNPPMGTRDSGAYIPTLVKRAPGPRTYILGHITNPDILIELLEGCGVDS